MDGQTTIGVAISIPPPWAQVLDAVRASSGDPLAEFIPAHLTLLGPTEIDSRLLGEVEEHLGELATRHEPFPIHLRGTGTFRPITDVVFVAVAVGIGACEALAADIRSGALSRDLRFPYHPHVTIAHDVPTGALDRVFGQLAQFDAEFEVDHFTLYVHGDDGRWRPIRHIKLAGSVAVRSSGGADAADDSRGERDG